MSGRLIRRRGTAAEHATFTGVEGEFTYDKTNKRVIAHDGTTAGGIAAAKLADFAAPPSIGSTTPGIGAFTTLSSSGAATLNSASVTNLLTASGGRIAFPATQNPSSGANTLDDYSEGTWTPALEFGGGSTGIVYSSQQGRYTKIGNIVYLQIIIVLTAKGSSTGSATVTGLPYSQIGGTTSGGVLLTYYNALSGITGALLGNVLGTTINFRVAGATAATAVNDTHFTDTSDFQCSAAILAA
jgi:hypothetical protein